MIRVAEGLGALALVVGLGGTLLSLWSTVRTELDAVDRVRILRSELEAAAARSGLADVTDEAASERTVMTTALLDELDEAVAALPLSTRAVVLAEVRDVRATFDALVAAQGSASALRSDVHVALGRLHDELTGARRARVDRNVVLSWALEATGALLLAVLLFLGHRLLAGYRRIEGANEVLEDRLRRRNREVRALRGELSDALETLRRTEERLREAFSQATEAQRARAELEARLEARFGSSDDRSIPLQAAPAPRPAPPARPAVDGPARRPAVPVSVSSGSVDLGGF